MDTQKLLQKLTVEEKLNLCVGADVWHTVAYEEQGVPAVTMADGPHGLRFQTGQGDMMGLNEAVPATCFPTASATGCSWDRELLGEIGAAIAREAAAQGVDVILGPGLNLKRSPLCGRNFEYFSEDPLLSGMLAGEFVLQAQKQGTGACLKHFAANSQEYKRFNSDSQLDERTLRELYLAGFEYAVRYASPAMVMCAYNRINGTYCSDNRWLLTDILRGEWGFSGAVVTDWGGMHDSVQGIKAGCDLCMPGGTKHLQKRTLAACNSGELTEEEIDRCAERILRLALRSKASKPRVDREAHHRLAERASRQSAVLLKNNGALPITSDAVALIGEMAKHPRYQGTGSSRINAIKIGSLSDSAPAWTYAQGYREDGSTDDGLLLEAEQVAKSRKAAVVVAGLPARYESEGFDRTDMKLPEGINRLIETVAKANANTIVILLCGSAVELPWLDKVSAVLYMGLPGQASGEAAYKLLTGEASPAGKLAETWPVRYEDAPCAGTYSAPHRHAQYREGIYAGYRYYETAEIPVQFPFGFGLSYTTFEYSDLEILDHLVRARITNLGEREGAEVAQLYIAPPRQGLHRPVKELRGFAKVFLRAGESRMVEFPLNDRCFAVWNEGWIVPQGTYRILVGASVRDIRLTGDLERQGAEVPAPFWQQGSWYASPTQAKPSPADFQRMLDRHPQEEREPGKGEYTVENTILELSRSSVVVRIMKFFMEKTIAKQCGGKADFSNPEYRIMYSSSVDASLFSMVATGGGVFSEGMAYGFVDIANGHFFRGIKRMFAKE